MTETPATATGRRHKASEKRVFQQFGYVVGCRGMHVAVCVVSNNSFSYFENVEQY